MSDLTCGHITQLRNNSAPVAKREIVTVEIQVTEESKKEIESILEKLEKANSLYEKLARIEVKTE